MIETRRGVRWCVWVPALLVSWLLAAGARAAEARIAVATNFAEAAARLEAEFERSSDHELVIITGSTGKLYAQIVNGAPFDALLAADSARPERLENSAAGIPGTRFTYATGRLALWSANPAMIAASGKATLERAEFSALAMANPRLAPYGAAAMEVLEALGLWQLLEGKIVTGENVGQAHALIATGNAELGFTALSYVRSTRSGGSGSYWEVPAALHAPIRQDAILLKAGEHNPVAKSFLLFLRSAGARHTIRSFGYDVP